jgi:predicted lysophospholipase L1 biosynthesis ABC-type transport system permease subunit
VLVVNRTFAERYLGDTPVGASLPMGLDALPDWAVVGVVEDARGVQPDAAGQPEVFFARSQRRASLPIPEISLLVRTRGEPEAFAALLRDLIREQDAALVPSWIRPMDELLGESLSRPRLYSTLVAAFALAALAVAGIGLFGVLSYTVAQRRREIGLRVALGARPADVIGLIGRRALGLALGGLLMGLGLFYAGSRLLGGLLVGVRALDGPSVAGVAVALGLVAALAATLPALRAARIDPQRALRDG